MGFIEGLGTGLLVFGGALMTPYLIPAGQSNISLAPSDYAFIASTEDASLVSADFKPENLLSNKVNSQMVVIPNKKIRMAPGIGWGNLETVSTARVFIVPGVRKTVNMTVEADTLDVVNISIPFTLTVQVDSDEGAAKFLTSVYNSLGNPTSEDIDKVQIPVSIEEYMTSGAGSLVLKNVVSKVYGSVPLSEIDQNKSALVSRVKADLTQELLGLGLKVSEFGYGDEDYSFNPVVSAKLQEKRDILTQEQEAKKAVETAREEVKTIVARQSAFTNGQLALNNQCLGLVQLYNDNVLKPAINKGLFKTTQKVGEGYVFGVPTIENLKQSFGCN